MKLTRLMFVALSLLSSTALAQEGRRADSILLNGQWEFVEGAGDEEAQTPAAAGKLQWQPTTLPGNFVPFSDKAATTLKFVWARRTFDVTAVKVVVMGATKWDWQELCDVNIGKPQGSRVFIQDGANRHPLLAGIDPQWLVRWNGLPGLVATGSLKGPAMDKATKLLWVTEPKCPAAAEVPAAHGNGSILFLLLDITNHIDAAKPSYDPAAENILLNVLGG